MAEPNEGTSPQDGKYWKIEKTRFVVQTHIFEDDLLPGIPVRENLPIRHRRLLYEQRETNTNENNTENTSSSEGSQRYNQSEEQQRKDARTFLYIGPYRTIISKQEFQTICWESVGAATCSLLTIIFDNNTLATRKLNDIPSPLQKGANRLKPALYRRVSDIIYFVKKRFHCNEQEVRSAIAQKCEDVARANQRLE